MELIKYEEIIFENLDLHYPIKFENASCKILKSAVLYCKEKLRVFVDCLTITHIDKDIIYVSNNVFNEWFLDLEKSIINIFKIKSSSWFSKSCEDNHIKQLYKSIYNSENNSIELYVKGGHNYNVGDIINTSILIESFKITSNEFKIILLTNGNDIVYYKENENIIDNDSILDCFFDNKDNKNNLGMISKIMSSIKLDEYSENTSDILNNDLSISNNVERDENKVIKLIKDKKEVASENDIEDKKDVIVENNVDISVSKTLDLSSLIGKHIKINYHDNIYDCEVIKRYDDNNYVIKYEDDTTELISIEMLMNYMVRDEENKIEETKGGEIDEGNKEMVKKDEENNVVKIETNNNDIKLELKGYDKEEILKRLENELRLCIENNNIEKACRITKIVKNIRKGMIL